MEQRTVNNQFPNFDNMETFNNILNAVREHNFSDVSWKNDAMPCMQTELSHGFQLVIWVDYKDAKLAEFTDERESGEMKQLMFGERDEDGEYTEQWQYDDADALIAHVNKVMTA